MRWFTQKKIAINPNFLHAFPTYHSLSKPANHVKLFLFENIWQLFPYNQTLGHIDHHVGGLGGDHQGDRGGHLGHGRQQDLEDKDGDLGLGVRFHSGGDSVKSGATTLPWPTNWVALAHTPPPGDFFNVDPFAAPRIGVPAINIILMWILTRWSWCKCDFGAKWDFIWQLEVLEMILKWNESLKPLAPCCCWLWTQFQADVVIMILIIMLIILISGKIYWQVEMATWAGSVAVLGPKHPEGRPQWPSNIPFILFGDLKSDQK